MFKKSRNKELMVRSRRTEKSVEVYLNLNGERGGAGGMKDHKPGIIREDEGIGSKRFAAVGASFRETANACPKALFIGDNEHGRVLFLAIGLSPSQS
jgi:hypothetical protein